MRLPASWPPRPSSRSGGVAEGGGQARLLATLYGHPEGVRLLAASSNGRLAYSSGRKSTLKVCEKAVAESLPSSSLGATHTILLLHGRSTRSQDYHKIITRPLQAWVTSTLVEETVHRPIAACAHPEGVTAVGLAVCPGDEYIAMGATDGSISLLSAARFGQPDAKAVVRQLAPEEGALLSVSCIEAGGGLLYYATEAGGIHGWDTRCAREAFTLQHERSLGLLQAAIMPRTHPQHVSWERRYPG